MAKHTFLYLLLLIDNKFLLLPSRSKNIWTKSTLCRHNNNKTTSTTTIIIIMIPNIFYVIGCSIFATALTTLAEWYLIYRTEEYKELKQELDDEEKQLEKEKKKKTKKSGEKVKQLEKQIQDHKTKISLMSFKSMIFGGVVMFAMFSYLSRTFDGIIVGKLPFEPFGFVTSFTHRGLPGTNYTDCAFLFVYILSTMSIRTNVQKYFGWQPANSANPFAMPEMPAEESSTN